MRASAISLLLVVALLRDSSPATIPKEKLTIALEAMRAELRALVRPPTLAGLVEDAVAGARRFVGF